MGAIYILTGEIGSGKTSVCLELADRAREKGVDLGGLLSPGIFSKTGKTAIEALDLKTGQKQRIAELKGTESTEIETRKWAFLPEAVSWANQKLLESVPCDLLIIDELGPLEFIQEKGWMNGIKVVEEGDYQSALVVVRPSLLSEASQRWEISEIFRLDESGSRANWGEFLLAELLFS